MIWFIADGELRCVDGARRCAVRGLVALASLEAAAEELRDRGEAEEGECVCDDAEGLHRLTLFGRPDQRRIEIEVRGEGSGRELELWLMRHALDELPVRPWREPPAPSPEEPPAPSPEEPPAPSPEEPPAPSPEEPPAPSPEEPPAPSPEEPPAH